MGKIWRIVLETQAPDDWTEKEIEEEIREIIRCSAIFIRADLVGEGVSKIG